MKSVVVALSGGVDSAVAAALLVQQGYAVSAVTLRLWSEAGCEQENRCCTPESREIARQVTAKLNIPFEVLNAADAFRGQVVQSFLDGYLAGETPNPCVFCNRHIKWGFMLDYANRNGIDFIATGHYARILQSSEGPYQLWKGSDSAKDQAYMLSQLTQTHLARTIFPLGELTKAQVRQVAHDQNLPAADLPESQDLCFLGDSDYRDFLRKYVPQVVQPGPILDRAGQKLGEHQGLAFYTIGQRKGLPASTHPLYVLEKRLKENILLVGSAEELGRSEFRAAMVNWIAGTPPDGPIEAEVKIRFKAAPAAALVTPLADGGVRVALHAPLRDVTPGQTLVIYQGDQVLGGGTIY